MKHMDTMTKELKFTLEVLGSWVNYLCSFVVHSEVLDTSLVLNKCF